MNFKSFKVIQDREEDPDGIFCEKMFLIEEAVSVMDEIYQSFAKLRVSPEWETEEHPELVKWISEGKYCRTPRPVIAECSKI